MESKEFASVVFDIDGTLTPETSWFVLTEGLGASSDEHWRIFQALGSGELSLEEAENQLLSLWQETGNANKSFIRSIFEAQELHPESQEIIDFLKSRGYFVCLISASVDLYTEVMAERVGVDFHFSNTELVWDERGNLIGFHYEPKQAEKKLEQLQEFLEEQGISKDRCVVVGDSWNDREMFKHTKRGVMIHTPIEDSGLSGFAWKSISSLKQLKDIL